jgi:type VI secretion system protein ImpH
MPTPQRPADAGLIEQLFNHPTRFGLFQALHLLLRWLEHAGVENPAGRLRFHNRMATSFPPSEVAAIWSRTPDNREIRTAGQLQHALVNDPGHQIHITPASFGLLGNSSAMPAHYTQAIADSERQSHDAGPRALLDLLGTRAVTLFYEAWAAYRTDCQPRDQDRFLSLQLALAGRWQPPATSVADTLPAEAIARYAELFRRRPVTAAAITAAVSDYFAVPVSFQPFLGDWYVREDQSRLGAAHCTLSQGAMLGQRCHRSDLAAEIRLGPLARDQYLQFLPRATAALALAQMLGMFGVVNMRYRVRLVLQAADIGACQLTSPTAPAQPRLGRGAFLHGRRGDSEDFCYDIVAPGAVARRARRA